MRWPITYLASLIAALAILSGCTATQTSPTTELIGRRGADRTVTPVNQVLTPYGKQIELPKMRPQAVALSPDGKLLAVSGKTTEVVVLDPRTGDILQRVNLPSADIN